MENNGKPILKRWAWGLGILAAFIVLAWKLENVATLVLLSFLLSYVLNPLVTRMSRIRFIGRTAATLITLSGLLIGFLAVLFFIIPDVITEFNLFFERLPDLAHRLRATVIPWIEGTLHVELPKTSTEVFDQIYGQVSRKSDILMAPAAEIARTVFGTTFTAVFAIISSLMLPLFVFFLLKDFPTILDTIDNLVPVHKKTAIHKLAQEVDQGLSAYLHGQFTVMLVLGTLYSIGYSIVGIPVAIGVGCLTGLLCFIPYVGAATGFLLALLLAALELQGWGSILGVIAVFATVQTLDAILITPRILGGKLGLQPLWIIFALMAGGELFGFLGVLLAVPTTAVLKILVSYTIEWYKKSTLYVTGQYVTEPPAPSDAGENPSPTEKDEP